MKTFRQHFPESWRPYGEFNIGDIVMNTCRCKKANCKSCEAIEAMGIHQQYIITAIWTARTGPDSTWCDMSAVQGTSHFPPVQAIPIRHLKRELAAHYE